MEFNSEDFLPVFLGENGMKQVQWFVWVLLGSLTMQSLAAEGRGAEKPNVLFLLVDDLGWSDLSY